MTVFERIVAGGCWRAWMRGTRGAGLEDLARIGPDLGEAFEALSRGDADAFVSEARRAASESEDSMEETAFIAYRGAIEGVSDGSICEACLARAADALFPGEAALMLRVCLGDLSSVLRVGSPGELVRAGGVLLRLLPESLERAEDADDAAEAAAALESAVQTLVSRCAELADAPGYPSAMERVSLIGLFGRLLGRSLGPGGPPPDPDSVRALSACIPGRWEDGTAILLGELYSCMCSLSGTVPSGGVTFEDLAGVFLDMTGFPDPGPSLQ